MENAIIISMQPMVHVMTPKFSAKQNLRVRLELMRDSASTRYTNDASIKIVAIFRKFIEQYKSTKPLKIISGFYQIKSEINTFPLLAMAQSEGYSLALPYIDRHNLMRFRSWSLGSPIVPHPKFAFPEPPESSDIVIPDISLVPLLGFNRDGVRIGYGMGYYDRSFQADCHKNITRVGCAFSIQELTHVEHNIKDVKLHFVITEKEIIDCRKGNEV